MKYSLLQITFIFVLFITTTYGQNRNPITDIENNALEELLRNPNLATLAEHAEKLNLLEKKLDNINVQLVRLAMKFIAKPDDTDLLNENIRLKSEAESLVEKLMLKQAELNAVNEMVQLLMRGNREMQSAYDKLIEMYNIDFYRLKNENYKTKQLAFLNEIKYRIEVVGQNIMDVDRNVIFSNNGKVVYRNGKIDPHRSYSEIQLKDCRYKIPSSQESESGFEKNCIFLIYSKSGTLLQKDSIEFVEDKDNPNPYTKAYKVNTDYNSFVKTIQLNEKIKSKDVSRDDFKFLVVEENQFESNERLYRRYKNAIKNKIVLSNDPEIVSKSLENLIHLSECDITEEYVLNSKYVVINLFDFEQEDNDRILLFHDKIPNDDDIVLKNSGSERTLQLGYFNTIRISSIGVGEEGSSICTLGIKIQDNIKHYQLKKNETVCIEINRE